MFPPDAPNPFRASPAAFLGPSAGPARPALAPVPAEGPLPPLAVPASRPLLGVTLLLVEDSRLASEGMRLMCLRSGARLRRADCLFSAERHLRSYRPGVAVVDLGLPDGSGLSLIRRMARGRPRIDAVIATSGDDSLEAEALAAGADAFVAKPVASLAAFQAVVLRCLPRGRAPLGPRALPEGGVTPDRAALQDDLVHAAEVLARGGADLDYVAQFLAGVAKAAEDRALAMAARALGAARAEGCDGQPEAEDLAALLLDRLALAPAI